MATSRTSKSALHRSIQHSRHPIYLVGVDMKITFANQAACDWVAMDEESLTALTCVYQSAADQPPSRKIANGLCPPPDSFTNSPADFFVYKPSDGGTMEFRQASGVIIGGTTDPSLLVSVFGQPQSRPGAIGTEIACNRELHSAISQMQFESASQINFDVIAGRSPAATRIRRQIDIACQSGASVLITGPPGSGRHRIAQLIHFAQSPALSGPLIPFDCNVGDAELLQAVIKNLYREFRRHPDEPLGRLLLKDIQSLGKAAESELLGFLDLPDFQLPVLATGTTECLTSTSRRLLQMVATITISLPSLAERQSDIPFLLQAVLEQGNSGRAPQFSGFEGTAVECLSQYNWPGELDELIKVVDAIRHSAEPPTIRYSDIPSNIRIAVREHLSGPDTPEQSIELDKFLADVELELIQRAVLQSAGNKSHAARLLGISRARLLRRLDDPSSGMLNDEPASDAAGDEDESADH